MSYKKPETPRATRNRTRKRNIIWFNPPYNKSVVTNVGQRFLQLVDKHFKNPRSNVILKKLFNRNNLKISYSCTRNIKSFVSGHNKKIINESTESEARTCNCPRNTPCPLNGKCLSRNTVYAGTITSDIPNYGSREYAGLCEPEWKSRQYNHTLSFNHREYAKCEIAKEIWRIKDQNGNYNVTWRIVGHAPAYNPTTKICKLCLSEKLYINEHLDELLNKRDELISKCMHTRKYELSEMVS